MKKVIGFTLYKAPSDWETAMSTNHNKYIVGLHQNLEGIQKYYPDWYIYLYHSENFDTTQLDELKKYEKFITKPISDFSVAAMQWRFLPNDEDDVDYFISRDVDSRVTEREKLSVEEWIDSGKILHIMRDHPHHGYHILGGMWGMKSQKDFNMKESCINYNNLNQYNKDKDWYDKWWDMNFLRDVVYPKYINSSYINASHYAFESWAKPFTLEMENNKFIGEIYDIK
jgi:hypothetical protein